jgi:hypothetical protein
MGTMNYAWIVESFFTLQGILILFDYLYRGVQSLRLFIRFWSRSVVKLPTIKAIEEEESALFNTMSSSVQCLHLFFRLLPLIWVQVLILLAMVVVTIFVISGKADDFASMKLMSLTPPPRFSVDCARIPQLLSSLRPSLHQRDISDRIDQFGSF